MGGALQSTAKAASKDPWPGFPSSSHVLAPWLPCHHRRPHLLLRTEGRRLVTLLQAPRNRAPLVLIRPDTAAALHKQHRAI